MITEHEHPTLISIPYEELEAMLDRAAEKGAKRALANVGLEGAEAADDVRELRSLLSSFQSAKKTFWQTFIRMVTTGILVALMAGLMIKLKLLAFFGGK